MAETIDNFAIPEEETSEFAIPEEESIDGFAITEDVPDKPSTKFSSWPKLGPLDPEKAYQEAASTPGIKPGSLEWKDMELTQKVFGKGKFGQAVHAYMYAATETAIDLSPVTFAKYLRTSERERFVKLSTDEQRKELLWETLMTELFTAGGALLGMPEFKLTGKTNIKGLIPKLIETEKKALHPAIGKAGRKIRGLKEKPKPINYPEYKGYKQEAKELLVKNEHISEREASAIVEHLEGNPNASNLLEETTSPSFNVIAKGSKGKGIDVDDFIAKTYSPRRVQMEASRTRFIETAKTKLGVQDRATIIEDIEAVYKGSLRKIYGDPPYEASYKQSFIDAAPELLDDITRNLMDSKKNIAVEAHKLYTKPRSVVSLGQPIRFVAQKLEPVLKAHSRIYSPAKEFGERVTDAHIVNIQEFMKLAAEKGLAKASKIAGKIKYKRTRLFTKSRLDKAYKIMRVLDDKGPTPDSVKSLLKTEIPDVKEREIIGHIVDVTRDWFDGMYVKQVIPEIYRSFEKIGIAGNERLGLSAIMRNKIINGKRVAGIETRIQELFNPKNAKSYTEKVTGMKSILEELQAYASSIGGVDDDIIKYLSMDKGNFTKYLENYFPRIAKKDIDLGARLIGDLPGAGKAFYKHPRVAAMMDDPPVDFEDAITRYSKAHAREMTGYYDIMNDVIGYTNQIQRDFPDAAKYFKHWLGRKVGLPTEADVSFAEFISNIPGINIDARRIVKASRVIQNAAVSGFLGFKPFSTARNMFQPLIMVPAELGNNGFTYLVKGFRHAFDPKHVAEMKRLKIFTDPMPDFERSIKFLRFGKGRNIIGAELPTYQGVVDATLVGYKGSDAWNRIWTSGAAKSQWLKGLRAVGIDSMESMSRASVPDDKILRKFLHNIEVSNRTDLTRYNIEELLKRGKWYDAYVEHIKEIVANTQFLYGTDDAPLALHPMFGAAGRASTIFQSWWMNYGQAMAHWMATGAKPADKMLRAFNWTLSGVIAHSIMSKIWGSDVATRSTVFGPFPGAHKISNLPISSPAALQVYKGLEMIGRAGSLGIDFALGADQSEIDKSQKAFERSAKSFVRSTVNLWVPAGLVARQVTERTIKARPNKKTEEFFRAFAGMKEEKSAPVEKY